MTNLSTPPASSQSSQPPVIKGSWEDLLNQAHRAAANQNDEAIALYEKVRNGLQRLSAKQLSANQGHLQELLETAATNLHVYLTQQEQYDAALTSLDAVQQIIKEEQNAWLQRRAMVLAQAGHNDEALKILRGLAESPEAKLTDWGNLVMQHAKLRQIDQARAVIDEASQWVEQRHAAGSPADGSLAEDQGYLENLRCIIAIVGGDYQAGVSHFERAAELDPYYKDRPHLLYARLVFYEQLELALPWVLKDHKSPIRAGFWHGVILYRQGKDEEANRRWQQVVNNISPQTDNEQFIELVLTFYYLGDREGKGLNGVLRVLQSGGRQSWVLLFLAGLGWMVRDNLSNARSNFALAVSRRKAAAEGTKLSPEVWQHCRDLLNEADQQNIIEYFQVDPDSAA
jgi:tetratricopeptide (TPR) repeat protein